MKNQYRIVNINIIVLISAIFLISFSGSAEAANRTSFGVTGGLGMPLGWWGERWEPLQSGEFNIRYEFSPGMGILLITGLNKTYFEPLSREQIADESVYSDVREEFSDYTTIVYANQGGSFKQLPIGFGFYMERMVSDLRAYGSLTMVVNNWKFYRSQWFLQEVTVPGMSTIQHDWDNWEIEEDGSDLGLQVACGALYKLTNLLYLDLSAAFHWVNISRKYGSVAYWGQPARIPPGEPENDLIKDSKSSVNSLQFRIGLRVGN
ncbi:MAG: hypothetical protein P9X24_10185 [Candidatus Hatepunaea meridiana]|nr:hypothetical protein [Candidatus Hatepunaea meridiana]